jgi:hypothetical protein
MAREVNENESTEKHMNDRSVARPLKTAMLTAYQATARGLVDVERKECPARHSIMLEALSSAM